MEAFFNIKANKLCKEYKQNLDNLTNKVINKRYLVLFSCHLNSHLRIYALLQNIKYLRNENTDFLIIYSRDQAYNDQLMNLHIPNSKLLEVDNDYFRDFNKWYYGLKTIDNIHSYDYFVFTNDSYVINRHLNYFYSYIELNERADLVSYCSSSEYLYHYQSFLFAIKSNKKDLFINYIQSFHGKPDDYKLMINMEIKIYYLFTNKTCLLNLGRCDINNKKNIFFHNQSLFSILYKSNVLPFIKLKMIQRTSKPVSNNKIKL